MTGSPTETENLAMRDERDDQPEPPPSKHLVDPYGLPDDDERDEEEVGDERR
jgi:hypothetical protein